VLQLREVAKPVPKDNQVLVKVQAASANALDFRRFTSTSLVGRFMDGVLLKAINTVLGVDIADRWRPLAQPSSSSSQGMRCSGYTRVRLPSMRVLMKTNWS